MDYSTLCFDFIESSFMEEILRNFYSYVMKPARTCKQNRLSSISKVSILVNVFSPVISQYFEIGENAEE